MKIELNIDAANLGETVVEVFDNLSKADKRELAKEAVSNWINEPISAERNAYELSVIDDLRQNETRGYGTDQYRRWNDNTKDDQIRKDSQEYRSRMSNYRSTRDVLVGEVSQAVQSHIKEHVKEYVETSPEVQKLLEATITGIKENFPSFVHDAMVSWFCQGVSQMTQGIQSALFQTQSNENITKQIQQHLNTQFY